MKSVKTAVAAFVNITSKCNKMRFFSDELCSEALEELTVLIQIV